MTKALAGKRILLTNDDGIHAPGLQSLETIAHALSDDVWVVAPETEQSGASHSLTLNLPLRMRRLGEKRFAVLGTPTDCVGMGTRIACEGKAPDLVLSGVNRGGNLAEDVTYSGTVAGAMEGTSLGIPSIALSQCFKGGEGRRVPYEVAEAHAPAVIKALVAAGWPRSVLINLNFPDCPPEAVAGVEITYQGLRNQNEFFVDTREDLFGQPYYWLGFKREVDDPADDSDLKAIHDHKVSVTPLHLDLTHHPTRERFERELAGRFRVDIVKS